MTPLRLPRHGATLVIAPHPDDEAIGAYGLIATLARRGARVRIVVIADGAASHPASIAWPRRRLIAERRRETRRAMRRIGVPAGDIRFLGLPDGRLSAAGAAHRASLSRAIRSVRALALLVLPEAADAHPDHRAVAAIAARVATPGARRLAYAVWPARRRGGGGACHGLALGAGRAAKRAAILGYRTQTGGITDDPQGFAIARHELAGFARPIELYREIGR